MLALRQAAPGIIPGGRGAGGIGGGNRGGRAVKVEIDGAGQETVVDGTGNLKQGAQQVIAGVVGGRGGYEGLADLRHIG